MNSDTKSGRFTVEAVPRHIHLSVEDRAALFGQRSERILCPLCHHGQYASCDTVTVIGPDRELSGVRVLGPCRTHTQLEIGEIEALSLGIDAPRRLSGDVSGSAGCVVKGPRGKIELEEGVIVPLPHLHCSARQAAVLGLCHGRKVSVRLASSGAAIQTVVRVHPTFRLVLHITADEAARLWLGSGEVAYLL